MELTILAACGILMAPRNTAMYYIFVFALDKGFGTFLKLVYSKPRPYMIFDISPLHCSKEFGCPSGHSSASWTFALTIFLD